MTDVATSTPARPRGATRGVRIGWVPAIYCILSAIYCLAVLGMGVAVQQFLASLLGNPGLLVGVFVGAAALMVLMLAFAIATLVKTRRLQHGTPGRGRLLMVATSGLVHLFSYAVVVAMLWWTLTIAAPPPLLGPLTPAEMLVSLPGWAFVVFQLVLVVAAASLLVLLGSTIATWFLVPERVRRVVWVVVDVPLLIAFIATTATLPMQPKADTPEALLLPSIRLTVTVLFGLRVVAFSMPFVLDVIEHLGVWSLVASRHLRAKKSSFLAAIGVLSIAAVTVSSCSLTTTLSVMGGFRNDLKQKILGNNAHVVVDKQHGTFGDWRETLDITRGVDGVEAATPYVSGEVMVTSASNLAGAVLRGIDPATVSDVVELEDNLQRGRIEYLTDPERLLDLPAEETRGPMPLQTPRYEVSDHEPPAERTGSPVHDVDEMLGDPMAPTPDVPGEDASREDIEEFLRGPEPAERPREILPGIIVGRELARSLRLYVGDEVNVVSPLGDLGPAGPMPKSRPFRVAGIFYSGMYEYDMKYAYVTLETAQSFLNTGDQISGIEIKTDDFERSPEVAEAVRASIGRTDVRVQDWQEANKNLFGALQLEKLAMFIFLGIAILVAGFCVFGTLTLMVQEKTREVGVLKALGARDKSIVGIFMIEGLMIGLFGSSLGLGLGYVVCFVAQHFGIRMNPEVYYIDKLPVHADPLEFTLVGVAAVAVCLVATIFPAVLASKVRPVDALRFE